MKAIVANRIAPGLLDRYLAKAGYDGQLTDQTARADAPANLFHSVDGEFGAHGRFDRQARSRPWDLPLSLHPGLALLALTGLVVALGVAGERLRRQPVRKSEAARNPGGEDIPWRRRSAISSWSVSTNGASGACSAIPATASTACFGALSAPRARSSSSSAARGDGGVHGLGLCQVHRRARRLHRDLRSGRGASDHRPV